MKKIFKFIILFSIKYLKTIYNIKNLKYPKDLKKVLKVPFQCANSEY